MIAIRRKTASALLALLASATPVGASGRVELARLSGPLHGSGSTFAYRYYRTVTAGLARSAPDLEVDYRPIGSGRGKSEFGAGLTDFAGTDSPVKDTDGPKPGEFLYVPTTAAAITVAFHLEGTARLRLSAPTVARIFQRDIIRWNDPTITAENPGVRMPDKAIGVVHRSDRSGTTSNFTKYLDLAAPGVWRLGSGDLIAWPDGTSQGEGNRAVAQILADNNGSIGYADLADARAFGLSTAAIRNKSGVFVRPTPAAVTAALAHVVPDADLTYRPLDADGRSSYPLTAPTYALVRTHYNDQETADRVIGFLHFVLHDGQALAERAGYARLPESLRRKALAQLDAITVTAPTAKS